MNRDAIVAIVDKALAFRDTESTVGIPEQVADAVWALLDEAPTAYCGGEGKWTWPFGLDKAPWPSEGGEYALVFRG